MSSRPQNRPLEFGRCYYKETTTATTTRQYHDQHGHGLSHCILNSSSLSSVHTTHLIAASHSRRTGADSPSNATSATPALRLPAFPSRPCCPALPATAAANRLITYTPSGRATIPKCPPNEIECRSMPTPTATWRYIPRGVTLRSVLSPLALRLLSARKWDGGVVCVASILSAPEYSAAAALLEPVTVPGCGSWYMCDR